MHILILGAAGMIGRKLTDALVSSGQVAGRAITRLTLVDVIAPELPVFEGVVDMRAADLSEAGIADELIALRPDLIFHLAAIVSGEAEANFEKGYRVNLSGTLALFEAIRVEGLERPYCPKLVFTSSIAVFGAPLPDVIADNQILTPLTSYGTQKAMGELLLADYSRRGFLDGIGIRLPTVVVRPGRPNKAASGFFSSILREPLMGLEAVLPVDDSVRHWFASPRAAVGFLLHAAALDTTALGSSKALTMPGVAASVADEIAALARVAGDAPKLIRREADGDIAKMIAGWPQAFNPVRALALGFVADRSMDEIVRVHIEDELGGALPAR